MDPARPNQDPFATTTAESVVWGLAWCAALAHVVAAARSGRTFDGPDSLAVLLVLLVPWAAARAFVRRRWGRFDRARSSGIYR